MVKITTTRFGVFAFICLIGTLIMRFGIASTIITEEIMKQLRLEPGTQLWEIWTDIPIPIFTKFYFFNVTNPDKVLNGDKPILKELGPYVYQEKRMKVVLTQNEEEISYRPRTTWFYRSDLSYGEETDRITLLNIPFVGVAKMAWDLSKQPFVLTTLDDLLAEKGERVFQTNSVRELLFDGVSIANYMELLSMPVTQVFGNEIKISERLLDGDFGFFDDRNGTADEIWVVKTGKTNLADFGRIVSWNGKPKMDVWKDDTCNKIQGTDGSIFPPFSDKNTILTIFAPDLCRPLHMEYAGRTVFNGVAANRFTLVPSTFGSLNDYPENKCYCKDTNEHCMKGGLMPIGPCQQGAPLFVSRPHFVGAHEDYKNGVLGIKPDSKDYESFIELEANIGQVVQANFKLQMNLELQSYDAMTSFANVPNTMFPLIWLEQSVVLTEELVHPVKIFNIVLRVINGLTTLAIITCVLGILAAILWDIKKKKKLNRICF